MNTVQKSLIAIATGSLLSVGAQAAVFNTGYAGQPYVGAKVGQIDPSANAGELDKATAYGVYAGYNFDPNFGAEVEYLGSDDSDYSYTENRVTTKGEGDVKTYGAYGTYRYYLPNMSGLYAKGKLGVARTEINASSHITAAGKSIERNKVDQSSTGLAGGVGIGFAPAQNIGIEAEYAKTGSDADLVTVGAHFKF
ncbi:porin family protein [Psychrobacter sp. I-STPA10]|uniref:porin family protein n=1 Tax=Psychrobacter sp. I-STPA10 TaxID=2585769 RepID=UPI001E355C94|nr:porin family protein [Psychrobacter sp. I-STPA10]